MTEPVDKEVARQAIKHDAWSFPELIVEERIHEGLATGVARYPLFRELVFAARIEVHVLFDKIALDGRWRASRLGKSLMLLDSDRCLVAAEGQRSRDYSSITFRLWADDKFALEEAEVSLRAHAGSTQINEPMFTIAWHFLTPRGELECVNIEELANDVLLNEAYPTLGRPVSAFIDAYLDAPETVLVLQGTPGTGKTRLIRAILGRLSERKGKKARALYTGDSRALDSDEIFVKFITGDEDIFVVEDADHLLQPRKDGNPDLHRFLSIADGVIGAQGRKIVFSTNLPNLRDLDDALVRPGRCFTRVVARDLTLDEALKLTAAIEQSATSVDELRQAIEASDKARLSLAEIYRLAAGAS